MVKDVHESFCKEFCISKLRTNTVYQTGYKKYKKYYYWPDEWDRQTCMGAYMYIKYSMLQGIITVWPKSQRTQMTNELATYTWVGFGRLHGVRPKDE